MTTRVALIRRVLVTALISCQALGPSQKVEARQPDAPQLNASDWAALERASFGATPRDAAQMLQMGRVSWLRSQTSYVGDSCLPEAYAARVHALPYASYDVLAIAQKEIAEIKSARESKDEEAAKTARRAYRRDPVEQAFERRAIRALACDHPLQEKMADFWMNRFNVFAGKGRVALFLPDFEESAVRPRMFGKFEDLLWATMTHPAMLEYLDNARNVKGKINENYARELMELHTMGVDGGYSQKDVQELARVLTGLGVGLVERKAGPNGAFKKDMATREKNGFSFEPERHDAGMKTVLGHEFSGSGISEARQVAHMLASHPSTARFVSRAMAQYFISDAPSPEVVEAMRKTFERTSGDLGAVVRAMVESPEFSNPVLSKFKEPQAWVFSAMRLQYAGEVPVNVRPVYKWIADLGQPPYMKLTPEGYANKVTDWSSADQMGKRFELSKQIVASAGTLFVPAPREGEMPSLAVRKEQARQHPKDSEALWMMLPRMESAGLSKALVQAASESEKRALMLASPEFMKR